VPMDLLPQYCAYEIEMTLINFRAREEVQWQIANLDTIVFLFFDTFYEYVNPAYWLNSAHPSEADAVEYYQNLLFWQTLWRKLSEEASQKAKEACFPLPIRATANPSAYTPFFT
jgi:hypothetical protein